MLPLCSTARSKPRPSSTCTHHPLLDQWYLSLIEDMNVKEEDIGVYGGGHKGSSHAPFVISTMASARTYEKPPWGIHRLLIVDECHRAGSTENSRAIMHPYPFSLGLSATPIREYDDGFQRHLVPNIGPLIFRYTLADAKKDNILSPFELVNIEFDLLEHEQMKYDEVTRSIARLSNDPNATHDQIESLLRKRSRISTGSLLRVPLSASVIDQYRAVRTIVFHEDISSAHQIATIAGRRGHSVTEYHTQIGTSRRLDNLRLFRRGVYDVLVCCRALDEGLNVPEANVAIIAAATASRRQRIQRLGRVLRPAPGKRKAKVITLYGTEAEKRRLIEEYQELDDTVHVEWQYASTTNDPAIG